SGAAEQRLDAEGVASAEDDPPVRVPDDEREHPPKSLHCGRPEMVVGRENHLGIARCEEVHFVRFAAQLFAELEIVVNLSIEQDRVTTRSVRRTPAQRLVGMLEIDDGQPVEAEHY